MSAKEEKQEETQETQEETQVEKEGEETEGNNSEELKKINETVTFINNLVYAICPYLILRNFFRLVAHVLGDSEYANIIKSILDLEESVRDEFDKFLKTHKSTYEFSETENTIAFSEKKSLMMSAGKRRRNRKKAGGETDEEKRLRELTESVNKGDTINPIEDTTYKEVVNPLTNPLTNPNLNLNKMIELLNVTFENKPCEDKLLEDVIKILYDIVNKIPLDVDVIKSISIRSEVYAFLDNLLELNNGPWKLRKMTLDDGTYYTSADLYIPLMPKNAPDTESTIKIMSDEVKKTIEQVQKLNTAENIFTMNRPMEDEKKTSGGKKKLKKPKTSKTKRGGMSELNPSSNPITQSDLAHGYSTLNGGAKKSASKTKRGGMSELNPSLNPILNSDLAHGYSTLNGGAKKSASKTKRGGTCQVNLAASPMTQFDLAHGYSTLKNGGAKKSVKKGGADPFLGSGGLNNILNMSDIEVTSTPYTLATEHVDASNAPHPFSAGNPNYASAEYGLPVAMTSTLSGGLDQRGGKRTSRKKKESTNGGTIMDGINTIVSRLNKASEDKENKGGKSKGGNSLFKNISSTVKSQFGGLNEPGSYDWKKQIGLDAESNMAGGKKSKIVLKKKVTKTKVKKAQK